jgi:hypothetical protein
MVECWMCSREFSDNSTRWTCLPYNGNAPCSARFVTAQSSCSLNQRADRSRPFGASPVGLAFGLDQLIDGGKFTVDRTRSSSHLRNLASLAYHRAETMRSVTSRLDARGDAAAPPWSVTNGASAWQPWSFQSGYRPSGER